MSQRTEQDHAQGDAHTGQAKAKAVTVHAELLEFQLIVRRGGLTLARLQGPSLPLRLDRSRRTGQHPQLRLVRRHLLDPGEHQRQGRV